MKEIKYTHIVKLYGVKCYANLETMEIEGVNWINNFMIELLIFIETKIPRNDGFYLEVVEELK